MADQERTKKLEELQKQREEIDRMIRELMEEQNPSAAIPETNIPYAQEFLDASGALAQTSSFDLRKSDPQELLALRLLINKKCNQASADFSHTAAIIADLAGYRGNPLFVEIFARTIAEQGRIQVSAHFDSYKQLSYMLFQLRSDALISRFVRLLVFRNASPAELRGIYAVYFGYLSLSTDLRMAWAWIASVLNIAPNTTTGYILETFLVICGAMLNEQCNMRFLKLLSYIRKYFLKEIANPPVELRLKQIMAVYDKKE